MNTIILLLSITFIGEIFGNRYNYFINITKKNLNKIKKRIELHNNSLMYYKKELIQSLTSTLFSKIYYEKFTLCEPFEPIFLFISNKNNYTTNLLERFFIYKELLCIKNTQENIIDKNNLSDLEIVNNFKNLLKNENNNKNHLSMGEYFLLVL